MDINPYLREVKYFKNIYIEHEEALLYKKQGSYFFINNNSLNLDIGCGNGEYLNFMARNNPKLNFIGIELQYKELYRSCKKVQDLKNVKLIKMCAKDIDKVFLENSISNVSIWFPDPWLKRKQAKHRVIDISFINKLYLLLNKGSKISIKTDNDLYFNIICNLFQSLSTKFEILINSNDVYGENINIENNYITAFERIFLSQNLKIKHLLINRI